MPRNISAQEAARRLAAAGFAFSDRYQEGVQNKGAEWQRGAAAGEGNYQAGIQKALADKSYGKGVNRAGGGRYDEGVRTKGVANWPTGMQLSEGRYVEGVAPFQGLWDQALKTPKGPRNSPASKARMNENMDRFAAAKK